MSGAFALRNHSFALKNGCFSEISREFCIFQHSHARLRVFHIHSGKIWRKSKIDTIRMHRYAGGLGESGNSEM
jgi:hypothetical protein